MNALTLWLQRKSSSLCCAANAADQVQFHSVFTCSSTVTLNSKLPYHAKLSALLHECGHIIIYFRRRRRKHARIYGCSYVEWWRNTGRLKAGSKRAKLAVLHEEIGAWDLGEALAKKLRIKVSKRVLDRTRTRALLTYSRDCN